MGDKSRFAGGPTEIAAAVERVATHRALLTYTDCPKVSEAKLGPQGVKDAHDLLAELHQLDSSVCFRRSEVRAALKLICSKNQASRAGS